MLYKPFKQILWKRGAIIKAENFKNVMMLQDSIFPIIR